MNPIRKAVSKKKKRFQEEGFDLDLAYITNFIVSMGWPGVGIEQLYRNPMGEVKRLFDQKHGHGYKVYNLCAEKQYPAITFYGRVEDFPCLDHEAPPFDLLEKFCVSVDEWLSKDSNNAVVVHCKAGKGRTGTFISCYLLYRNLSPRFHSGGKSPLCSNAQDPPELQAIESAGKALDWFAQQRTRNRKGVTIPSQQRYVYYFEQWLRQPSIPNSNLDLLAGEGFDNKPVVLTSIHVRYASGVSSSLSFCLFRMWEEKPFYDSREMVDSNPAVKNEKAGTVSWSAIKVLLRGDTKVVFYIKTLTKDKKKLCQVWFNTNFLPDNQANEKAGPDYRFMLHKRDLDKLHKDKHNKICDKEFEVELNFDDLTAENMPHNLKVQLTGFEVAKFPKPHAIYYIDVFYGSDSWKLIKRYNDFYELKTKLEKKYPKHEFVHFPRKRLKGNLEDTLLEKRRRKLDVWLNEVLTDAPIAQSLEMKLFLHQPMTKDIRESIRMLQSDALPSASNAFKLLTLSPDVIRSSSPGASETTDESVEDDLSSCTDQTAPTGLQSKHSTSEFSEDGGSTPSKKSPQPPVAITLSTPSQKSAPKPILVSGEGNKLRAAGSGPGQKPDSLNQFRLRSGSHSRSGSEFELSDSSPTSPNGSKLRGRSLEEPVAASPQRGSGKIKHQTLKRPRRKKNVVAQNDNEISHPPPERAIELTRADMDSEVSSDEDE